MSPAFCQQFLLDRCAAIHQSCRGFPKNLTTYYVQQVYFICCQVIMLCIAPFRHIPCAYIHSAMPHLISPPVLSPFPVTRMRCIVLCKQLFHYSYCCSIFDCIADPFTLPLPPSSSFSYLIVTSKAKCLLGISDTAPNQKWKRYVLFTIDSLN